MRLEVIKDQMSSFTFNPFCSDLHHYGGVLYPTNISSLCMINKTLEFVAIMKVMISYDLSVKLNADGSELT